MANLLERFRTGNAIDNIDWDALKRQSMYPDLIGKMPSDTCHIPSWMKCDCGMLVMTSPDLHGQSTTCANCKQHQHDAVDGIGVFVAPRHVSLKPQVERRVLFGLVVFCLITASVIGGRVWDAPPRAQANIQQLD